MKAFRRDNITLIVVGLGIGVAAAAAYAVFRAANNGGSRWSTFGESMVFPGLLVIATVVAMVWLGWKANIDD